MEQDLWLVGGHSLGHPLEARGSHRIASVARTLSKPANGIHSFLGLYEILDFTMT